MNGVQEVWENSLSMILPSTFSRIARPLAKGMVVALVPRSPLAIVSLKSGVAHELGAMHYLLPFKEEKENWQLDQSSDSENDSAKNTEILTKIKLLALLRDDKPDK